MGLIKRVFHKLKKSLRTKSASVKVKSRIHVTRPSYGRIPSFDDPTDKTFATSHFSDSGDESNSHHSYVASSPNYDGELSSSPAYYCETSRVQPCRDSQALRNRAELSAVDGEPVSNEQTARTITIKLK
ncbi:hypothetical protein G7046_g5828 [Stylonectria norvegica]|nr:hypothetical protein G7046_g5828 [Stylonectria norvegica]